MLRRRPNVSAFALGLLSATGFAPLSLWPCSVLALAGLIVLAEQARDRRGAFARGWSFALGHFALGLNWIAHAFTYQDAMPHWFGYGAVALLSAYLAVYPALAVLGVHMLRARWPRMAATPLFAALWLVAEMARASLFTGFAWNPLGAVWLDTGVDQAARWIGTYGLGALVVLSAGAVLAVMRRQGRMAVMLLLPAALALLLPAVPVTGTRTAITVVQPNIGQEDKHVDAKEEANFAKLASLTRAQDAETSRLIFWPEAAIPAYLDMEPEWRWRVADLLGRDDLMLMGGVKVYFKDQDKGLYADRTVIGARNATWIVTPGGRLLGRYDKAHLVPYGEYLPMRNILEPMGFSRLVPGSADFWPGPGPRTLPLPAAPGRPALHMGLQICYEIIFSGQVIDRAHRPDFLFNPSNDAWFGAWGPPQHVAQARLRAIEEAMPVIRSTPTGISAVIDAGGRVNASLAHHKAGAIHTTLPAAAPPSLFATYGNLLPLCFAGLLFVFAVASLRRTR